MKDKFNKYCAEVMGHKEIEPPNYDTSTYFPLGTWVANGGSGRWNYNPYDDLNQRALIIDELAKKWKSDNDIFYALCTMKDSIEVDGIDKATKDFIISIMPDKEIKK